MSLSRQLVLCSGLLALGGCIPEHLKKYQHDTPVSAKSNSSSQASTSAESSSASTASGNSDKSAAVRDEPQRATIYALDKQTFRFAVNENDVWESALNVLLRNYNLTIVDKTSGVITTEWDTYYLNGAVYRNKVSVRVGKTSRSQIDVTIHNNVERLKDASQAASGTVGAVWLPADDVANEVARLVQNMALVLNQPPPVLPPNMNGSAVARDFLAEPSNVKR